jgi:hypothetical protein
MNRDRVYKSGFIIGTILFAGFVSWTTNWEFGVVWYATAVVTTDLMFILDKIYRHRPG